MSILTHAHMTAHVNTPTAVGVEKHGPPRHNTEVIQRKLDRQLVLVNVGKKS